MAVTLKGKGVVWGAGGFTYTGGIASATTVSQGQSATLERSSDKGETRDGDGEVIAQQFYNAKKVFRVNVVPTGDTIGAARTSLDAWAPAPGSLVTVADAASTVIDDLYNVISSTVNKSNTDAANCDVEFEQYDANEVATTAIT